jgi:Mrp family chromosome partitioning ATPase
VVVDSPALMVTVAAARILCTRADAVVLVVRGGVTPREVLRRLQDRMPNVVGVVLNAAAIASACTSCARWSRTPRRSRRTTSTSMRSPTPTSRS